MKAWANSLLFKSLDVNLIENVKATSGDSLGKSCFSGQGHLRNVILTYGWAWERKQEGTDGHCG